MRGALPSISAQFADNIIPHLEFGEPQSMRPDVPSACCRSDYCIECEYGTDFFLIGNDREVIRHRLDRAGTADHVAGTRQQHSHRPKAPTRARCCSPDGCAVQAQNEGTRS